MRLRFALCAGAIAAGLVAGTSMAAPVGPGQTLMVDENVGLPQGTPIAEIKRDVAITYVPVQPGFFLPLNTTRSFVNQVFRDPVTQHLTFVLHATDLETTGFELASAATYGSFDDFTTDVHAQAHQAGIGEPSTLQRDLSGNITIQSPNVDISIAPIFVVNTNATDFDRNGFAHMTAKDEFELTETDGVSTTLGNAAADFTIDGLFQPKESGTVAVPLPPAVYGGLAMLAVIALPRVLRKGSFR
jgi:hypothetical protein